MPDETTVPLTPISPEASMPAPPELRAEETEADAPNASEPEQGFADGTVPPPEEPEESAVETIAEVEGPAVQELAPSEEAPNNKQWYVVKVQSGREESIKEAIERRSRIEALEEFLGKIIIPVERVTEMRHNKRVVRERKLFPGYLMVEVEFNDRILYLFRETSGVGDFVGGGINRPPTPMTEREVAQMLHRTGVEVPGIQPGKPIFDRGDRVKVKDGTFAGMEGEVKDILEAKSLVRVELTIFGRPVPVELEYWQVEPV